MSHLYYNIIWREDLFIVLQADADQAFRDRLGITFRFLYYKNPELDRHNALTPLIRKTYILKRMIGLNNFPDCIVNQTN